jgi:hypothetical protein
LFDGFGQVHHICVVPDDDSVIVIGRDRPFAIVSRSVSREHVALIYRAEDRSWYLQDCGSRNGTRIDGVPVGATPRKLDGMPCIAVAEFEFRFIASSGSDRERLRELISACPLPGVSTVSQFQVRSIAFAPIDGDGGFVTVVCQTPDGRQCVPISLSALDFALLHLLATRYVEMSNFEPQARGWVSSAELLAEPLPFGTETPTSNNLRGAIKRIRDKFRAEGIEPIESKQNVGYRLNPSFDEIQL